MKRSLLICLWMCFLSIFSLNAQNSAEPKSSKSKIQPRIGIIFQYNSNFKNLSIYYPSLNYTGLLGGYTGKGGALFAGIKPHKYLAIDLETGFLLNSYNEAYSSDIFIQGRFNKYYALPTVKFIYPLISGGFGTINPFIGGGFSLTGAGRLYISEEYYGYKDVTYARFNPMLAPVLTFGTELHFSDLSNLIIGLNYQNGSFTANEYSVSYSPVTTVKNAPDEIKNFSAQGLSLRLGIMHEF